jgi:hypothetical protein
VGNIGAAEPGWFKPPKIIEKARAIIVYILDIYEYSLLFSSVYE